MNTCRFCGSEDHVPGEPATWCPLAQTEYVRASEQIDTLLVFMLPPARGPQFSPPVTPNSTSALAYTDEVQGALYGPGIALVG